MKAILRKTLADLFSRPWQSALILATMAGAGCLLYLGLATMQASTSQYDKLMSRTNGAHAMMRLPAGEQGQAAAGSIAALPGVVASVTRPAMVTDLALRGRDRVPAVLVTAVPPGQPAMMGYVVVAGHGLSAADRGKALLDVSLANYFGISIGDQVEVSTPSGPQPVTVVGLTADPAWVEYPLGGIQSLFVLPETLDGLAAGVPEQTRVQFLGVRLAQPAEADRFITQAKEAAGQVKVETPLSWLELRLASQMIHGFSVTFILAMGLLALVAGAMITANIVGGAVLSQYRELATLKVIGFTARQVLLLVVTQNALLGLLGGAAGTGLGQLAAVGMLARTAQNTGNPDVLRFAPGIATIVVLALVLVACLTAAAAASSAVAARPAAALREGFAAPHAGTGRLARCLAALHLPVALRLGIQDALARPARSLLTIGAIALTLLTITANVSTSAMITRLSTDPLTQGINYDVGVELRHLSLAETEQAVRALPGMADYYTQAFTNASAPEQGRNVWVRAVGGGWTRFPFVVLQGRMVRGPEEVALASNALKSLGVRVGDRLRLEVAGHAADVEVVGEYRDLFNLGQVALMTLDGLHRFDPQAQPGYVLVKLKPGVAPAAARQSLLQLTNYRIGLLPMDGTIPPFILDSASLARWLALLMVALAGLGVVNATLLTAREQTRQVGIRKAVGMTPAQVLTGITAGGALLGLVGSTLAMPLGLMFSRLLVRTLAGQVGFSGLATNLPPPYIPLLLLGGTALAALAALPAGVWASLLSPARVLQAE